MAENDYSSTVSGIIIGGRDNRIYSCYASEPDEAETDENKQTKQGKCNNDYGQSKQTKKQHNHSNHQSKPRKKKQLLGAIALAYSSTPQQYHCPPLPPYNHGGYGCPPQISYGGHDYYGGYRGQGYSCQFPPPNQGGYNYGMSHYYSGANHGGAAPIGAPVVIDMGLPSSGAAAPGAAASEGHGHGGAHMAMGDAARAAHAAYAHESYHGGGQTHGHRRRSHRQLQLAGT